MPGKSVTRRTVLRAGTTALLPAAMAGAGRAAEEAAAPPRLTIGISTLGFSPYTNAQLAQELAEQGFRTVQLFLNQSDSRYWKYNGRSDLSGLTAARCEAIAAAYRSAGLAIHSLGVYTNLVHADPAERQANLAYFEAMMKAGADMGVTVFITEAGHYHPETPTPSLPYHFRHDVWVATAAAGKALAELAERHGATVLLESYFGGFLASAKRTRVFLEEINSPRIRALLDPANLLEVNALDEMFQQLGPWIDCLHAKDRKLHVDRGVAAGQGDLDYRRFVALAARHAPHAPLVLEYVGPRDYRQALAHLEKALRAEGLRSG